MSGHDDLPDHARVNRTHWDDTAGDWVAIGERAWASDDVSWGIWAVPDAEVDMFPADMAGIDAIEMGCGTAYVSAWMARRGARVTAVDNSAAQLSTAKRLMEEHSLDLTLMHGNAETIPLPDASFDFAINEYGAATWCEPEAWLREAHRLLRPGGRLAFLTNHPMAMVCSPENGADIGEQLVRPYFGMHKLDWTEVDIDPGGISYCLPLYGWVALFNEVGFVVDDLREPQAPVWVSDVEFHVGADWAKRWPTEVVWKVHKA